MERQDPQGEENGDPAFAHVPRMGPGGPQNHPGPPHHHPGPPHHSQHSMSSKDSSSSNPNLKQQPQVSMSVSSSIPQSSAIPTGSLHQGPMKAKDAHQIKLQQLQSQQQQLLIAAAAVASSATSSATASATTTGMGPKFDRINFKLNKNMLKDCQCPLLYIFIILYRNWNVGCKYNESTSYTHNNIQYLFCTWWPYVFESYRRRA